MATKKTKKTFKVNVKARKTTARRSAPLYLEVNEEVYFNLGENGGKQGPFTVCKVTEAENRIGQKGKAYIVGATFDVYSPEGDKLNDKPVPWSGHKAYWNGRPYFKAGVNTCVFRYANPDYVKAADRPKQRFVVNGKKSGRPTAGFDVGKADLSGPLGTVKGLMAKGFTRQEAVETLRQAFLGGHTAAKVPAASPKQRRRVPR